MNGDGNPDMITGEYWPGDIYSFAGNSDGTFQKMESLKDDTGRNLNGGDEWKNEQQPNMKSLAAAPYATDWDGDGDFDMLIGNIEGSVTLLENIGSKTEPLFSAERQLLNAANGEIKVNGDSGPVFEDWDADGRRDLIIGGGDGAVVVYMNVGEDHAPEFAAQRTLIAASSLGHESVPHGQDPSSPGTRVKVNVVDYDQDGLVDLLVGDFISLEAAPRNLSEEQEARRDELKSKIDEYSEKAQAMYEELSKRGDDFASSEEMQASMEAMQKKLDPNDEMQELMREYQGLSAASNYHGFVWFYKRLPETSSVASLSN